MVDCCCTADVYLYCMEQVSSNDITRTKIFISPTLSVTIILSFQLVSVVLWLRIVFTIALCACFILMRVLCAHELSWPIPDEQRRMEHACVYPNESSSICT
jgi:hypothetical protein